MKKSNGVFCCSLAVMLATLSGGAFGAIRAGNAGGSYAGSYKNTMALQQQYNNYIAASEAEQAAAEQQEQELPVRVADENLAEMIKNGDSSAGVDFTKLDACSMIYPGGEFAWDTPNMGNRIGSGPTCVAIVEMRFLGMGNTGDKMDLVVARGKLAAGDTMKCNISSFPQSTYLPDIENVIFPADKAPTRQDVIQVMNQEQKSKAGLKIAAGLLVGGIGGNLTGKNDAGKDGLFGTSKDKLKNTAIGAAAGAALMTAGTFSGKVAGDVIMGAGVNAAAGGLVGNMSGTGDSVLRVEKCEGPAGPTTCLWGRIQGKKELEKKSGASSSSDYFYNYKSNQWYVCETHDGSTYTNCELSAMYEPQKIGGEDFATFNAKSSTDKDTVINRISEKYTYTTSDGKALVRKDDSNGDLIKINSDEIYSLSGTAKNALILDFPEKKFGSKMDDWYKWLGENKSSAVLCLRDGKGNPTDCDSVKDQIDNFKPTQLDADDGELIDVSNKARLGSTLKGAGLGAGIGGFTGYQGAQSDIDERLTQATREYNDSLEKIYCGTGQKFLQFYNDDVEIPMLAE